MELTSEVGSPEKKCSFPLACMRFFGKKENETTVQFAAELRALTTQDKADLCVMFEQAGWEITTK